MERFINTWIFLAGLMIALDYIKETNFLNLAEYIHVSYECNLEVYEKEIYEDGLVSLVPFHICVFNEAVDFIFKNKILSLFVVLIISYCF